MNLQNAQIGYPGARAARKIPGAFVSLFVLVVISIGTSNATGASLAPIDYRIGSAGDKFGDTWLVAVAFKARAPKQLKARYLEVSIGSISTSTSSEAFASIGPVWRIPFRNSRAYVDLGFSPTLLSGSTFRARDLGDNFQFTSSATIGSAFGKSDQLSLALRIRHTSNGGIRSSNPGMDVIGLSFSYRLDSRSFPD